MITKLRRRLLVPLIVVAGLVGSHALLHWILAERDVAATLLSAGSHSPPSAIITALLFMLLRLLTIVVLPGWIGYRLVMLALDGWRGTRS